MKKLVVAGLALLFLSGTSSGQHQTLTIGQQAPDITAPMPDGTLLSLSSLKGKLVVIDFWASWCAPCLQEQPELKALYEGPLRPFVQKGLVDMLGVSLDKSRENWTKAIRRFGIPWPQVSDLRFWKSQPARDYGLEELPFNVIVDKNGRILALNLHGRQLEAFLLQQLSSY